MYVYMATVCCEGVQLCIGMSHFIGLGVGCVWKKVS